MAAERGFNSPMPCEIQQKIREIEEVVKDVLCGEPITDLGEIDMENPAAYEDLEMRLLKVYLEEGYPLKEAEKLASEEAKVLWNIIEEK